MSTETNKYEILGVSKNATILEITKAYKRKALKHHPDKNGGSKESSILFREISEAFIILSDETKRAKYDAQLPIQQASSKRNAFGWGGEQEDTGGGGGGYKEEYEEEEEEEEVMDEKKVKELADFISSTLGRFAPDVHLPFNQYESLDVTLEECFTGTVRTLYLPNHHIRCPLCLGTCKTTSKGSGLGSVTKFVFDMMITKQIPSFVSCRSCLGKGIISKPSNIQIKVPMGCRPGDKTILKGFGSASSALLGLGGDLIVTFVQTKVHSVFHRHPDPALFSDLIIQHTITLKEALCGFKLQITHLDKNTIVNYSSEKQTFCEGEYICIPGKGMPKTTTAAAAAACACAFGDLHIRLHIVMPKYEEIMFSVGMLDSILPN